MSSRAGGRKRNDLQDYVFNDSDNGTATHQVWKCKGEGCNFEKKLHMDIVCLLQGLLFILFAFAKDF